jgi:hypothetical protein
MIRYLPQSASASMDGRAFRLGLLLLTPVAFGGCERSSPVETAVRGQILYRGEPVSGGLIAFAPNADRGTDGPVVTASLANDGSFSLTATDGKPIRPGWYRISVAPRAGTVDQPTPQQPHPGLPAKYRNPALSGLEHEIKAGADNLICFDLED